MTREVNQCRDILGGGAGRLCGGEEQALMEDTLEGLQERMGLLDSTLEQHCDSMRDRLQEHSTFQVSKLDCCTAGLILISLGMHLVNDRAACITDGSPHFLPFKIAFVFLARMK